MCNIAIYITGASLRFIYLSVKPVLSTCSGSGIILALEIHRDFPGGSDSKESACNAGDLGLIPGSGRSPEEKMATHSNVLDWRIPWTEEPGRLQSTGSQRVGHNWGLTLTLKCLGFPGGSVGKEPACNAGDTGVTGLIPGSGRIPGEGHDNPIQYSCLENLMDKKEPGGL